MYSEVPLTTQWDDGTHEVEGVMAWWREQGEPGFERNGLTVTPSGQRVWLDRPHNPVPARGVPPHW